MPGLRDGVTCSPPDGYIVTAGLRGELCTASPTKNSLFWSNRPFLMATLLLKRYALVSSTPILSMTSVGRFTSLYDSRGFCSEYLKIIPSSYICLVDGSWFFFDNKSLLSGGKRGEGGGTLKCITVFRY